jgi:hypothetical protein
MASNANEVLVPRSVSVVRPQAVTDAQKATLLENKSFTRATNNKVKTTIRDTLAALGLRTESEAATVRLRELAALLFEQLGLSSEECGVDAWSAERCIIFAANVVDADSILAGNDGVWSTEKIRSFFIDAALPGNERRAVSEALGLTDGVGDTSFARPGANEPRVRIQSRPQQHRASASAVPRASIAPTVMRGWQHGSDSDDDTSSMSTADPLRQARAELALGGAASLNRHGSQGRQSLAGRPSAPGIIRPKLALDPAKWMTFLASPEDVTRLISFLRMQYAHLLTKSTGAGAHIAADMIAILETTAMAMLAARDNDFAQEYLELTALTALKRLNVADLLSQGCTPQFAGHFSSQVDDEQLPEWIASAKRHAAKAAKLDSDAKNGGGGSGRTRKPPAKTPHKKVPAAPGKKPLNE